MSFPDAWHLGGGFGGAFRISGKAPVRRTGKGSSGGAGGRPGHIEGKDGTGRKFFYLSDSYISYFSFEKNSN